jgi:hypothetical protein
LFVVTLHGVYYALEEVAGIKSLAFIYNSMTFVRVSRTANEMAYMLARSSEFYAYSLALYSWTAVVAAGGGSV